MNLRRTITNPALVITFVLFVVGIAYYYHPNRSPEYYDGFYVSECCAEVTIIHGRFLYGSESSPISIRYLKYGYVGRLSRPVGPFYHISEGKRVSSDILFHDDGTFTAAGSRWQHISYKKTSNIGRP